MAILQQDLLERDVEEATKIKRRRRPRQISDPSMAGKGEEEGV